MKFTLKKFHVAVEIFIKYLLPKDLATHWWPKLVCLVVYRISYALKLLMMRKEYLRKSISRSRLTPGLKHKKKTNLLCLFKVLTNT